MPTHAPTLLSVRNTFLEEAEFPRTPARSRTWSEPVCFKPSGEAMIKDLSSGFTDASKDKGGGSGAAVGPSRPCYVPTPMRGGCATGRQPSSLHSLEDGRGSSGCSSQRSSQTAAKTPGGTSRRVSFFGVDAVVHIPEASPSEHEALVGKVRATAAAVAAPPAPPPAPPTAAASRPGLAAAIAAAAATLPCPAVPASSSYCLAGAGAPPKREAAGGPSRLGGVVERVRAALAADHGAAVCVETKEGRRGWTITAYIEPQALKTNRSGLVLFMQQKLAEVVAQSGCSILLGYATSPFTLMPLGFGAAIAALPDPQQACWSSFARGFCDEPSGCQRQHPTCQVGINVMLKPARHRS